MFYRIEIIALIKDSPTQDHLKSFILGLKNNLISIPINDIVTENSSITIHKCTHDDYPKDPCISLYHWQSP